MLQLQFNVLMGLELEYVASELNPVLETLRAMGKIAQPVPVLAARAEAPAAEALREC